MNRDDETRVVYDRKYTGASYYWGVRPSDACLEVLRRLPPDRPLKLLDVGCGEGRNAVFFARNGYADLNTFRLQEPFVAPAPDRDPNANLWLSGELFTLYADWRIEWCTEELFDCMSGGVPHQHAVNRIIARKVAI